MKLLYKSSIPPKKPQMGIHNFGFGFILYYLLSYFSVPFFVEMYTFLIDPNFKDEIFNFFFIFDEIYTYRAVLLAVVGIICFILGYYIFGNMLIYVPKIYRAKWSIPRLYYWGVGLFFLGYLKKLVGILTGTVLPSQYEDAIIGNIYISYAIAPNPLHLFGLLLLIIYIILEKRPSKRNKVIFIGSILWMIYSISIINLGSKYMMLAPIIFFVLVTSINGRIPLRKSLVKLSLFTILIFTIDQYKNSFSQGWKVESTLFHRIDPFIGRLSQIQTFSQIIKINSEPWYGRSFLQFFEEFKPRSLRGDYVPQNWAIEYQLISENDTKTGIAPTNIGAFYLNFGTIGLILGMLFLGILFRIMYNFLSCTWMFCYIAIPSLWVVIIHGSESFIALLFVAIIKTFLLMTVIHLLLVDFKVKLPHRKVVL